jgi:nucleotide-binding universal stress UspA family protein
MSAVETRPLIALKNILVATDFSEYSQAALTVAVSFARRHGAKLWVTHVVPPHPRLAIPIEAMPARFDAECTAAERDLASLGQCSLLEGIPHELVLERGELGPVLSDIVATHDIGLIVVGTHGRGGVSKLLLGSQAEEIVRLAPSPVLTVGPESFAHVVPQETLGRILYATDFQPASVAALAYALWLARENRAHLMLLHALDAREDAVDRVQLLREQTVRRLVELIPADARLDRIPEFLVEFGAPADVILLTAAEKKADLIVMGARRSRHPYAVSHLAWAMTHRVLARATCPVLTVRG